MASVNKVILLGRLGKDPESRDVNGQRMVRLAVATSRRYKGKDGEKKEETEWSNVIVWGRTAEIAEQYLRKGSECYIEGRMRTKKYTGKDGVERWSTDVIAESLQLGARPEGAAKPAAPAPAAKPAAPAASSYPSDDIPF